MGKYASASKPYQGVRVKDPVKELLRRKRGNGTRPAPLTTTVICKPAPARGLCQSRRKQSYDTRINVRWKNGIRNTILPKTPIKDCKTKSKDFHDSSHYTRRNGVSRMMVANNTLPSYTHAGTFTEATQTGLNDSVMDVGGLCTGWIAQTTSTTALQPLSHWSPTDCQQHDPTLHSHTADMYVQPICPSYTVVGPSSMFTLGHTPLFTNLGAVSTSNSTLPQVEVPDLTYIPWAQSLSTISCPVMQAPSMPTALSGPQLFPVPLTLPVFSAEPEQVKPPQAPEGSLALEKLLEEDEGHKETYICNPSLFSEDI